MATYIIHYQSNQWTEQSELPLEYSPPAAIIPHEQWILHLDKERLLL